MKLSISFFLILLTSVVYCQDLKCYDCIGCAVPFKPNGPGVSIIKCPSGDYSCGKIDTKEKDRHVVTRGCSLACKDGSIEIFDLKTTVSCCKGDLCNY